jgi:hypothetical protein
MKGMRFEAVSPIQQTFERTEGDREEAFSQAFDLLYEQCKRYAETGGGTILSDGINKYFLSFLCGILWPQFRNSIVTLCTSEGYVILAAKKQQLITVHAVTEKSFILDALLLFKLNQKTGLSQ